MLKTYSVEMVKVWYNGEVIYNEPVNYCKKFEDIAEDLALEKAEKENIDEDLIDDLIDEIFGELEENAEYYNEDRIDDDYYIEQEYYASVL